MTHTELVLSSWRRLDILLSKGSNPVHLTGHDLTIPQIIFISRHRGQTSICDSGLRSMNRSHSMLENKLKDGHIIYGVNTGFGGSADLRTNKLVELQQALVREFHFGILPPGERDHDTTTQESYVSKHGYDLLLDTTQETLYLPESWTRAAIAIRINSLINGCSAARPVIVERMQGLLQHNIIPMIPLRGSISASGDLSPLSYICGAIQGKSTIRILSRGPKAIYADTALANASLEPVNLQAKEGLAMTNGTAISAAAAALALHDTHGLAIIAQALTAMTVEALLGTVESFHSFFAKVRPHPGQIECARNISAFLGESKLAKANDGADSALRQDRYSVRTVPQWLGPILEDLVLADQQISIECNSVTDNPLVTPGGDFLHGGNFQAKAVTSAMEKARQATQGIGRMLFSQCTELINPATSRGLPPNLVAEDPSMSLIFKAIDLNIASLTAELGFLANPVNHVQTAEMGNQSLNSLALISARYTHTANEVLSQLVASHLITACQALDLRAMQNQFLELYRPQLEELVSKYYLAAEQPASLPTPCTPKTNGHTNGLSHPAETHTASGLTEALWAQLLRSLDTTVSMDALERSGTVAKSLRTVILDTPALARDPELAGRLEDFTEAVGTSLHDTWCANRDAYLVQGDATPLLGKASRALYTFIRRTLNVPFLATWNLKTPSSEEVEGGTGVHGSRAPSVGSYTGAVYRALRDGTLTKVTVDLLVSC